MGQVRKQSPTPSPGNGGHQSGRKAKNKAEVFWEVEMRDGLMDWMGRRRGSSEADARLLVLVPGSPFRGGRDGVINSSILDVFHLGRMRGDVRSAVEYMSLSLSWRYESRGCQSREWI